MSPGGLEVNCLPTRHLRPFRNESSREVHDAHLVDGFPPPNPEGWWKPPARLAHPHLARSRRNAARESDGTWQRLRTWNELSFVRSDRERLAGVRVTYGFTR